MTIFWKREDTRYRLFRSLSLLRDALNDSTPRSDPFMGVPKLENLNNSLKSAFGINTVRHVIILCNYLSKVLEIKKSVNRLILMKELVKVFENAIDSNLKVDSKISYNMIPILTTCTSSTTLSIQPHVGGDSNSLRINGELVNVQNTSGMRMKLEKIYERGCTALKVPENLSCVTVFVIFFYRKKAAIIVIQMCYTTFHDRSNKTDDTLENLTKFDRIVHQMLIVPFLEVMLKLGKNSIMEDATRAMSLLDHSNSPGFDKDLQWYYKPKVLSGIIQSIHSQ